MGNRKEASSGRESFPWQTDPTYLRGYYAYLNRIRELWEARKKTDGEERPPSSSK